MTELAPGFFVHGWIPPGTIYKMRAELFLQNYVGTVVAIHPDTWELIPGATREEILDQLVKATAERGIQLIERALRNA